MIRERNFLLHTIRSGYTIPVAILIVVATQVLADLYYFHPVRLLPSTTLLVDQYAEWMHITWVRPVVNAVCIILTGLLMIRIDSTHKLYPNKSSLCFAVYAFLFSTNITLASSDYLAFYNLIAILTMGALFDSYNLKRGSVSLIFNIFFLIAAVSLFDLDALLYIPILWVGAFYMRVFGMKAVIASVIGTILPYVLYLFWCFYTDTLPAFMKLFDVKPSLSLVNLNLIQPYEWAHFGFSALITVPAVIHSMKSNRFTKIKTRAVINYLILFLLYSLVIYVFNSGQNSLPLAYCYLVASFLIGRYLTAEPSSTSNSLFQFGVVLYSMIYVWSVWLS